MFLTGYRKIIFLLPTLISLFVMHVRAQKMAQYGDLIITEIMIDPTPIVGLPDAEWVEIHNNTNENIENIDVSLGYKGSVYHLGLLTMEANGFVVFCHEKNYNTLNEVFEVQEAEKFPSGISNSLGDFQIIVESDTIYKMDYDLRSYQNSAKNKGGYTLEMIDLGAVCVGRENWIASQSENGGTPNTFNSYVDSILFVSPINLYFKDKEIILESQYELTKANTILWENDSPIVPEYWRWEDISNEDGFVYSLLVEQNPDEVFTLGIEINYVDCKGAERTFFEEKLIAPKVTPHERMMVINEILYRPLDEQAEFVELFNNSDQYLPLNHFHLMINENSVAIDNDLLLEPNNYVVLSQDPSLIDDYFELSGSENLVALDLPRLVDQGATLSLLYNDENEKDVQIDEVVYRSFFHHGFLNDDRGISLERIDPNHIGIEKSNWSSCQNFPLGGTPLQQNSIAGNAFQAYERLDIEYSKVVSPNADGLQDVFHINIKAPDDDYKVSASLHHLGGERIVSIFDNQLLKLMHLSDWSIIYQQQFGHYFVLLEIHNNSGFSKVFRLPLAIVR